MYDHISAARFLALLSFSVYKIRDYIITYVVSDVEKILWWQPRSFFASKSTDKIVGTCVV